MAKLIARETAHGVEIIGMEAESVDDLLTCEGCEAKVMALYEDAGANMLCAECLDLDGTALKLEEETPDGE